MSPHEAIRLAKAGQLHPKELLEHLVAGKVAIPLAEAPRVEEGSITGWKPATVSKPDGSQWLVAFTTNELVGGE